jgi:NAD(P)-dependent dehydrogenase (short-subunit alcohol dehydrogenase family)
VPVADLTEVPLASLISLAGKTAVVTGGARGIGSAIARRLAEAGANVVVADVDAAAAVQTAKEIAAGGATGAAATGRGLDVTSGDDIAAAADAAVDEHGSLDIWVNNAGIYPSRPLLDMTEDDWDRVLDVNLRGAFIGSREAARRMVAGGSGGVIVNIASVSGYRGRKGLAHYSSSKHGLRGLTRSLAVELGPQGIRALGIAPTMVVTPGTEAAAAQVRTADMHSVDVYSQLPLGRPGVPDDIARVVLFCASDLASFMTGSTLAVDAGQMAL